MFPSQKEEHDLIKKVFKEVEGTGQRGALIGLVKFKPFIDQYISYQIEHQVPEEEWVGANDLELDYDEVGTVDTSNINHDTFADSWYDGEEQVQNILEKLSGVVDIEKMTTHNMIEDDGDTYVKKGIPIAIPGIGVPFLTYVSPSSSIILCVVIFSISTTPDNFSNIFCTCSSPSYHESANVS
jgi:hypothetical protein